MNSQHAAASSKSAQLLQSPVPHPGVAENEDELLTELDVEPLVALDEEPLDIELFDEDGSVVASGVGVAEEGVLDELQFEPQTFPEQQLWPFGQPVVAPTVSQPGGQPATTPAISIGAHALF